MAKKLNSIYLEENEDLETHTILVDGDEDFIKRKKGRWGKEPNKVWAFFRPIVVFVASASIVAAGCYYIYQNVREKYFDPVDINDNSAVEVSIKKGSSLSSIAEELEDKELIRNKQIFKLYTDFSDMSSKLKAGTYVLSKNMSFDDIIYTLSKGMEGNPTAKVVLREGFGAAVFGKDIVDAEVEQNADPYVVLCKTAEGIEIPMAGLKEVIAEDNKAAVKRKILLEGYLFPDTYEFYKDTDPAVIVQRQIDRFNEIFTDDYLKRAEELDMTVDDIVTLASIIERESKADQFKQVSAVLYNRLNDGWPLQSDAALAYGLDVDKLLLDGSQLETENPYNTHLNTGLPIGPIGNPGRAAIEAALWPDETYMEEGYMFFALMNPETGELAFSKTLDEHNAVKQEYLEQWQQADDAIGMDGEATAETDNGEARQEDTGD